MAWTNQLVLISLFLITAGSIKYILNLFNQKKMGNYLYALLSVSGLAAYFMKGVVQIYFLFFIFAFVSAFYIYEHSSSLSRKIKYILLSIASLLAFYVGAKYLDSNKIVLYSLLILAGLLLPFSNRKIVSSDDLVMSRVLHFLFRSISIYLFYVFDLFYGLSLYIFCLVFVVYFLFSILFHKNYNKNNEDTFISLLIVILLFYGAGVGAINIYFVVLLLFISDGFEEKAMNHNREVLPLSSWLSPVGIKTYTLFYLALIVLIKNLVLLYCFFGVIFIGMLFSFFRPKDGSMIKYEVNKQYLFMGGMWLALVMFSFVGRYYGV